MGNHLVSNTDDDFDSNDDNELGFNAIHFTLNAMDMQLRSPACFHPNNLPVIRKKPDLEKFEGTDMYREISALSGYPCPNSPADHRWNLLKVLQRRENGLEFSQNQQRYISNMFIPNQKTTRLMSLESKVFVTKFNKDGSRLLTACQDGYVRIYDGAKGTYHLLNRINARDVQWSIIDADFSPNGQHFAYSTWSRSFFIMPLNGSGDDCQWIDVDDMSTNRLAILSLRYSPTGDKIIGGSNNSAVVVGDVGVARAIQIVHTHRMPVTDVNAVCFVNDKDPNVIIAGCDDGLLKVYDLRTSFRSRSLSKSVVSFIGHYDGITYIDSRNDGYYLLSNSKDQSIKIWDMRQPSNMRSRCSGRQQQLKPTWDYRWDRVPREFYNPHKALNGDTSLMTYRGHRVSKTLLRAKFSPLEQTGQRYIYTGCATGRIIIYDVLTGKIQEAIEGHRNVIRDLDWHPKRSEIVSGSWDSHVHLNTYNRNTATAQSLKRRRSCSHDNKNLRRSRRLANRNQS